MSFGAGTTDEFERALAHARSGHAPGFDYLWNRFSRQVVSFARLRGSQDPDGIANDTFVAAFLAIDRFRGGESDFVSFLFAITRNKVVDEIRKRSRQVSEQPLVDHDPAVGDIERDAFAGLSIETREALGRLTGEQREIVFLRIVADLPLEQVASLTGRTVGATKAMQHRALSAMRKEISRKAVSK